MTMTRKLVSYRLADDLQQALKDRASSEGISATELVNRLLRQGLATESPGDRAQQQVSQRVSQLEQMLHQLEKRVANRVPDQPADDRGEDSLSLTSDGIGGRLVALDQRLDALTTRVEQGCHSLRQLSRLVQGLSAQGLPTALGQPGPSVSTPEPTAYSPELSQDVVQMPLAALRKLLSSDPVD